MLRHASAVSVAGRELPGDLAGLIFPDRDEFHFGRHDALAGVVDLGDVVPGLRAKRFANVLEPEAGKFRIGRPHAAVPRGDIGKLLDVPARENPVASKRGESLPDVDGDGRIRIGARRIVDRDRSVRSRRPAVHRSRRREADFPHRHAHARAGSRDVHLLRGGKGSRGQRRCRRHLSVTVDGGLFAHKEILSSLWR